MLSVLSLMRLPDGPSSLRAAEITNINPTITSLYVYVSLRVADETLSRGHV